MGMSAIAAFVASISAIARAVAALRADVRQERDMRRAAARIELQAWRSYRAL